MLKFLEIMPQEERTVLKMCIIADKAKHISLHCFSEIKLRFEI